MRGGHCSVSENPSGDRAEEYTSWGVSVSVGCSRLVVGIKREAVVCVLSWPTHFVSVTVLY